MIKNKLYSHYHCEQRKYFTQAIWATVLQLENTLWAGRWHKLAQEVGSGFDRVSSLFQVELLCSEFTNVLTWQLHYAEFLYVLKSIKPLISQTYSTKICTMMQTKAWFTCHMFRVYSCFFFLIQ